MEDLKRKNYTEESGTNKYITSHNLKYKMEDERYMEAHCHELQKICHEIITKGMSLDEQFQIVVIIKKTTPRLEIFQKFVSP